MAEIEGSKITDITGGSELDKMDARAKAAVVVVSLGADRASQIYKYLSEQEIEDLTYEVAKLGKTNNAQVENALDEFYKMCLTHKMMTDGGLDYARSVLEKAFGETTARNLLEKVSKTLQSKPFNFFTKGDPKLLWSSFFVTLVAKKIVLINLCCRPCFIWGSITIITVWTNMIIINVCKFFYLLIECFLCCKLIQICAFILQGIEITLHRCIVVRISCFAHALCHIYRFAEFGKCFGRIL